MPPGTRSHRVRFGVFLVDFAASELLKNGVRLRLPEQAMQILEALVETPGEVVSREDLRQRLWPADTFVDYNHGLNVMVNKLREVLGDSAKAPVYIETVPRRGYRFVAPVVPVAPGPPVTARPELVTPPAPDPPPDPPQPPARQPALPVPLPTRPWIAIAAALVFVLAAGALLRSRPGTASSAGPPPRVLPVTAFSGSKDFPAFSPDGSQIVFAWVGPGSETVTARDSNRSRNIYIKVVDSGEPLRLTASPYSELLPAWSPDGRQIAFLRREPDGDAVYLIPALGGAERRIGRAGVGIAWTPDSKNLVLASAPDALGRSHLVLRDPQTGSERALTQPGAFSDSFPAVSPDGRTIAFIRSWSASARDLMQVPIDGGEPRRLTHGNRPVWGCTWAPDGRSIIYSSNGGDGDFLWRVPASGGPPEHVAIDAKSAYYPSASRTGNRLVFTELYQDSNLYLYQGEGFRQSVPLLRSTREDHSPVFSPDAQWIAFVSKRTGSDEIWVARSDGSSPMQLTRFQGPATGSPRWSPDGTVIVFDSRAAASPDIYTIGRDGTGLRQRTSDASEETRPAFSSDGKWIYFHSNRSGSHQIWKMPAGGGEPRQITRGGGFDLFESPDGKRLYYTKAGRGIWTVPVEGGPETLVPGLENAGLWRSWAVTPRGLYYTSRDSDQQPVDLRLYSFASARSETLLQLKSEPLWLTPGLSVSADGASLLYAQLDHAVNDILLIDHFR